MNTFIYALRDPNNGSIRYVGKSNTPEVRLRAHLAPANLKADTHKNRWLKSLNGVSPELVILEECSHEGWQAREQFWVSQYPNLTNGTAGGEGSTGATPETRRKLSEAMRGERHPNYGKFGEESPTWGLKWTPEQREKLSQIKTGKPIKTKTYILTYPDGTEVVVDRLKDYCEEHGLHLGNLTSSYGKHRGVRCVEMMY